ncbi:MAG: methylthioribulose 1-phosphate dehydratase [Chrysiogenetes bacterium]|nr:methylthioribulose 1-phosphate dehydratase [Chrysiogenetes bacterium]
MSDATPENLGPALCEAVGRLAAQGLCRGTSGNFSARLSADPLRLVLTRSGRDKSRLGPEDLMVVDGEGAPADGESGTPSAEALLHGVIARHANAGAILHVHSPANTLLGMHFQDKGGFWVSGYEMLKGLEGVTTHDASVFVPVVRNSQDMEVIRAWLEPQLAQTPGLRGFLIAGHGLYAWGADVAQAYRHVEIFEFLFECLARRTSFGPFKG